VSQHTTGTDEAMALRRARWAGIVDASTSSTIRLDIRERYKVYASASSGLLLAPTEEYM